MQLSYYFRSPRSQPELVLLAHAAIILLPVPSFPARIGLACSCSYHTTSGPLVPSQNWSCLLMQLSYYFQSPRSQPELVLLAHAAIILLPVSSFPARIGLACSCSYHTTSGPLVPSQNWSCLLMQLSYYFRSPRSQPELVLLAHAAIILLPVPSFPARIGLACSCSYHTTSGLLVPSQNWSCLLMQLSYYFWSPRSQPELVLLAHTAIILLPVPSFPARIGLACSCSYHTTSGLLVPSQNWSCLLMQLSYYFRSPRSQPELVLLAHAAIILLPVPSFPARIGLACSCSYHTTSGPLVPSQNWSCLLMQLSYYFQSPRSQPELVLLAHAAIILLLVSSFPARIGLACSCSYHTTSGPLVPSQNWSCLLMQLSYYFQSPRSQPELVLIAATDHHLPVRTDH